MACKVNNQRLEGPNGHGFNNIVSNIHIYNINIFYNNIASHLTIKFMHRLTYTVVLTILLYASLYLLCTLVASFFSSKKSPNDDIIQINCMYIVFSSAFSKYDFFWKKKKISNFSKTKLAID